MKNKTYIIAVAIFLLALVGALAVLLLPAPQPVEEATKEKPVAARNPQPMRAPSFGEDFNSAGTRSASASTITAVTPGSGMEPAQEATMTAKERTMETIQDAMTTWSAEGVPVLQPLLLSPDEEIRGEAIEAMKQIGVPEAVAALRAAAKQTTNPNDRRAMLEAAEWAELPPLIAPPGN